MSLGAVMSSLHFAADPSLTVTTVSSSKGACRSPACKLKRERTRSYLRSLQAVHLQYEVLGNFSKWQGWRWMSNIYEEHAAASSKLDPEHLLIAMDSSDCVVQAANAAAIIAAYRQIVAESPGHPPLVMALETGCHEGRCTSIPSTFNLAVPGNSHVNGGFVMGPARSMQTMWNAVRTTNVSCCHKGHMDPQLGMGVYALRNPSLVAFDTHQRLAAIINLNDPAEWASHYTAVDGVVTNRHTGIRPAFLHFPGQQFPETWRIYREQVLLPRGLISPTFGVKVGRSATAANERRGTSRRDSKRSGAVKLTKARAMPKIM